MSLASRIGDAWRALRGGSGSKGASWEQIWRDIYGGRPTKSGQEVSWRTALDVSTVNAVTRVLGNGVAQPPFKLMRESEGRREPAKDHPLYEVLALRPNEWQTSFQLRRQLMMHLVLCSNAFVFKNLVQGRVRELLPLQPGWVTVEQLGDWSLRYKVRLFDKSEIEIPAAQIWHLRAASWNGWYGLEAVKLAREAIGLAMASEESQANMHKNGVRPTGLYAVEGVLTKEQYAPLREQVMKEQTENGGGVLILDRKATFTPTTMTGVDAQHLETRKFQIEEICRAIGVQPIMVGHPADLAARAAVEQMLLAHLVHTMDPWYVDIEQSADVNLLSSQERAEGYYTKFTRGALLAADAKGRSEYFSKALGAGGSPPWLTQDEVRELEDRNPKGGKAGELAEGTNPGQAPKPPEPDPQPKEDDE